MIRFLSLSSGELYTWGKGRYGRLGHGDSDDQPKPKLVEALLGYRVIDVACGNNFGSFLRGTFVNDVTWSGWGLAQLWLVISFWRLELARPRLSLGDVIDPNQLIDLFRDRINFLSFFSIRIWSRILTCCNEINWIGYKFNRKHQIGSKGIDKKSKRDRNINFFD